MQFQIIFLRDKSKILVENLNYDGIFCMVKFKGIKYPQNISYRQYQCRNMFWINIEKSIKAAV